MNVKLKSPSKASALFLLSVMVVLGVFPLDVLLPSYPALADGSVLLPFPRLFIVATR